MGSIWNPNGTGWATEVDDFASLPPADEHPQDVIYVSTSTGLFWNKRKGLYQSDGVEWTRLSNVELKVLDSEATFSDDGDNTKKAKLQLANITTGNTRELALADYDYDLQKPLVDCIDYETTFVPASEPEGRTWWNPNDLTLNLSTGLGPVLQVGQENYVIVHNGSGGTLFNGSPVHPVGGVNGRPSVDKAIADTHEGFSGEVVILTMDILAGEIGVATRFGKVRGLDTSTFSLGDTLWVSATVAGELTNVRPEFPDYVIQVGGVVVDDVSDGEIIIGITGRAKDTTLNFWNGVFRETFDFLITSTGGVITGSLSPANGHDDMTMIFSDGLTMMTATPPATVVLTAGSDNIPQTNFVYVPKSTKVLTISISDWPTTEHIKVGVIVLRTAATTETEGALRNQNWNDHVENTMSFQGHLSHITERIRQDASKWESGVAGSVTGTPSNVYIATTSGVAYQMHRQAWTATSMPTDDAHIVNHSTTPFLTVSNLNGQILDATGAALSNSSFSFVVWGVMNKAGEASHVMVNLPIGNYSKNNPASAVADAVNFSVYDIPKQFQGVGFLIARFTFVLQADGITWSLFDTEDLRGKTPNTTAGGGAGGIGVIDYTGLIDTPSAYTSQGNRFAKVNAGETALEFTSGIAEDASGNVGIGTIAPTTDAVLDVQSTVGAFMPPRMDTTARDLLTASNGMMIYNTTTNQFEGYENGSWVDL